MHDICFSIFSEKYKKITDSYFHLFNKKLSPYVAFNPLKEAILHTSYSYSVNKNFNYDANSSIWKNPGEVPKFGTLFSETECSKSKEQSIKKDANGKKKLLFISPEMVYTGAPRSLLRMCKVARNLGYNVTVWSGSPGPFSGEYQKNGFDVDIVPREKAHLTETISKIKRFLHDNKYRLL